MSRGYRSDARQTEVADTAMNSREHLSNHIIICGLGSLGQHCVSTLKSFGLRVTAIERQPPTTWELASAEEELDLLVEGDCRHPEVLRRAGVEHCRAVLLVTSDERINVGAALAVRTLNPHVRLVVRSAQDKLNQLLADHLGNFTALEPIDLSAHAFALAALGADNLGFFRHHDQWLRVVEHRVGPNDEWCLNRRLYKLSNERRQVMRHVPAAGPAPEHTLHSWDPDARVAVGDLLVCLEVTDRGGLRGNDNDRDGRLLGARRILATFGALREWLRDRRQSRASRQILVYGATVLLLVLSSGLMLHAFHPLGSFRAELFASVILLLGGFADVFEVLDSGPPALGMELFGLFLSVTGIALVGVLYALVTERLLNSRFQFAQRRPPLPTERHVVVIGVKRVGQRVAEVLSDLGHKVVCLAVDPSVERGILPGLPVLFGSVETHLKALRINRARAVVATTEEEMLNLEIGLEARAASPDPHLVIRTFERGLADHLAQLLPNADVICAYSVAADAFAGAAMGESIRGLFRLNDRTILISEYEVKSGDVFDRGLLADVAYGYTLAPVALETVEGKRVLFPGMDVRLNAGDRLLFLCTIDGLRRIEHGELSVAPHTWRLSFVDGPPPESKRLEVASVISLTTGMPLAACQTGLAAEGSSFTLALHRYQLHRLRLGLQRLHLRFHLESAEPRGDEV